MIDGDTAAELIRIKNAHLAWGPKKIREIYEKRIRKRMFLRYPALNGFLTKPV